jgi:hypothetical protein
LAPNRKPTFEARSETPDVGNRGKAEVIVSMLKNNAGKLAGGEVSHIKYHFAITIKESRQTCRHIVSVKDE